MSNSSKKAILNPGKYYIGDLCYVIGKNSDDPNRTGRDDWMHFLEESYWKVATDECPGGPVEYKGHKGFAAYTAYGDGCYSDEEGNTYGVDAGMIGIIPIEACEVPEDKMTDLGHVFEFKIPIHCFRDAQGVFTFESDVIVTIDTDPRYDDFHEDDDDESYDDE